MPTISRPHLITRKQGPSYWSLDVATLDSIIFPLSDLRRSVLLRWFFEEQTIITINQTKVSCPEPSYSPSISAEPPSYVAWSTLPFWTVLIFGVNLWHWIIIQLCVWPFQSRSGLYLSKSPHKYHINIVVKSHKPLSLLQVFYQQPDGQQGYYLGWNMTYAQHLTKSATADLINYEYTKCTWNKFHCARHASLN